MKNKGYVVKMEEDVALMGVLKVPFDGPLTHLHMTQVTFKSQGWFRNKVRPRLSKSKTYSH